jgi:transcriptional regulator with XRE-family HTH domain
LLRHGRFTFTERELMEHLRMTYRTIKQREADPSTLTIAELLRVADLLDEPVEKIFAVVLSELQARSVTPVEITYRGRRDPNT